MLLIRIGNYYFAVLRFFSSVDRFNNIHNILQIGIPDRIKQVPKSLELFRYKLWMSDNNEK